MRVSPLTNIILEKLLELGEGTLDVFFPKNYSYAALSRPLLGLDRPKQATRHNFSSILWRLQQRGLVERDGPARKSVWRLSPKGKSYCAAHQKQKSEERKKDGITRLVIFDIPEYERKKRTAVRTELVGCRFRPLQKSVWIGECLLPRSFMILLDDLELRGKVHIFSVREKGTIDEKL